VLRWSVYDQKWRLSGSHENSLHESSEGFKLIRPLYSAAVVSLLHSSFLWPPCIADADIIFMIALCNRADHYIFALWFLSSFFFFSSPNLSGGDWRLDVYHTSTPWYGLSANLECMSEMCCTLLAEIQDAKDRHFGTIAQLCRAVSSQLGHISTIEKKLVKRRYLRHMFS